MSTDGEECRGPDDGEMLPDEKAVIEERLHELEDTESHLSTDEVAAELGIDLDE